MPGGLGSTHKVLILGKGVGAPGAARLFVPGAGHMTRQGHRGHSEIRRPDPVRGPRHAAASADRRSRQAGDPGRRRADDPPHRLVAGVARRRRSRAQPAPPARDADRGAGRRPRSRRARPLLMGAAAVLGSAGGPRQARPIVGADTFLIVNGDTLTDVDLARSPTRTQRPARSSRWRSCPTASSCATAACGWTRTARHRLRPPRSGGRRLVSFHRRAGRRRPRLRRASSPAPPANSIGGVYDALIASQPGRVRGVRLRRRVLGRRHAGRLLAHVAGVRGRRPPAATDAASIASARVTRSILWDDVEVGAGAQLDECIVTDGVRVPRRRHRTAGRFWCAARTAARSRRP